MSSKSGLARADCVLLFLTRFLMAYIISVINQVIRKEVIMQYNINIKSIIKFISKISTPTFVG